jgi:hypothetical protein
MFVRSRQAVSATLIKNSAHFVQKFTNEFEYSVQELKSQLILLKKFSSEKMLTFSGENNFFLEKSLQCFETSFETTWQKRLT